MERLREFDAHDPSAWENFYPFMESLFGPEWPSRNTLKRLGEDNWGGRWRCQMCDKAPVGHDQLIAH
eukprot:540999-Prorocentrum_lima.AAC.1